MVLMVTIAMIFVMAMHDIEVPVPIFVMIPAVDDRDVTASTLVVIPVVDDRNVAVAIPVMVVIPLTNLYRHAIVFRYNHRAICTD